jgi:hypothetical protein
MLQASGAASRSTGFLYKNTQIFTSPCAGLCGMLPPLVASKGQEKGNS